MLPRSKFLNKKTVIDGLKFDSKKEAERWKQLTLLEAGEAIAFLKRQVSYRIVVNDVLICRYVADFVYVDLGTGHEVVEDVKSPYTRKLPVYRLKAKLMKAVHGIEIREV